MYSYLYGLETFDPFAIDRQFGIPGFPPFSGPVGGPPGLGPIGGPPGFGPIGGPPGFGPIGGPPGLGPIGGAPGQDPQSGPPSSPPPSFIPTAQVGAFAVDPGSIGRCLFRYTYVWLRNRQQFWFYPTFVGRQSVSGWRWTGFFWVYFGISLRQIESFTCV